METAFSRGPGRAIRLAVVVALAVATLGASATGAKSALGATTVDPWLDPTFGTNGVVQHPFGGDIGGRVAGAARAPDGDLVLAIEPAHTKWNCCLADVGGWALARLAPDGTPRAGFGVGGLISPSVSAAPGTDDSMIPADIAIDGAGRIVLAGRMPQLTGEDRPVVVRRLATGAIDTSFGVAGTMSFPTPSPCSDAPFLASALPLGSGHTLVIGTCSSFSGFQLVVGRLTAAGALDKAFATAGVEIIALTSVGACCALDVRRLADGRIVMGIGSNPATVVRLTADGSADAGFGGGDGVATTTTKQGAARILALADGRVVFEGHSGVLSRLLADGSIDSAFGDVIVPTPAACGYPTIVDLAGTAAQTIVALQCLEGVTLTALDANGQPDSSYGSHATTVRSTDSDNILNPGRMLVDDAAGLIVVGADRPRGIRIERRLPTGELDPAFGTAGGTHLTPKGRYFTIHDSDGALDSKGRLVTAVSIANRGYQDEGAIAISRFRPDGSADATFGTRGTTLIEAGGRSAGEGEQISSPRVLVRADDSVAVVAVWQNDITIGPPVHEVGLLVTRLTASGARDPGAGPDGTRLLAVPGISEVYGGMGGVAHGVGDTILVAFTRSQDDGDRAGIVRLLGSSGDVDTSYGTAGYVTVPDIARSGNPDLVLAGLPDGSALLGWEEFPPGFGAGPDERVVAHVRTDGSIDDAFGTSGRVRQPAVNRVALTATTTGKAVLAWAVRLHPDDTFDNASDIHVRRLTAAGGADTAFGTAGTAVLRSNAKPGTSASDRLLAIAAYGERPLLLVDRGRGTGNTTELVRLSASGKPDASFGAAGTVVVVPVGQNVIGPTPHVLVNSTGAATIVRAGYGPTTQTPQDLLASRVLGSLPPSIFVTGPPATTLTGSALFTWRAISARGPYRVERRTAPAAGRFGAWAVSTPSTATRVTIRIAAGTTTCVRIRGANRVVSKPACVTAPIAATALRASAGWTTVRSPALYAGSARRAAARGASLQQVGVAARSLVLVATRCPGCGDVDVLWNGTRIAHVSLNGAARHRVVIPIARFATARRGTVQIRVSTSGRPVTIEGLAAWRDDVGG